MAELQTPEPAGLPGDAQAWAVVMASGSFRVEGPELNYLPCAVATR